MSGRRRAPQGFPLTLSLSKGERKAFFNGLLAEEALPPPMGTVGWGYLRRLLNERLPARHLLIQSRSEKETGWK